MSIDCFDEVPILGVLAQHITARSSCVRMAQLIPIILLTKYAILTLELFFFSTRL